MNRNNSPWAPVQTARIDWPAPGQPYATEFDDVYYARENGLRESEYVFLEGSDLARRWHDHPHPSFRIAETGFGTGLNFLLSWRAWQRAVAPPRLHMVSIEKHPMARADLATALAHWPELTEHAQALLEQYPSPLPGPHRLCFDGGAVVLDLWWEDVAQALPDLASSGKGLFDAWYLDGFAPARNAAMWQPAVYAAMAAASRRGASFATFTAASDVRRGLSAAGFSVDKAPGYGRKRECLRGRLFEPPPQSAPRLTPWDLPAKARPHPRSAIVIGGGLAGCSTAAALARRNIHVTVVEQATIAGAASGNDQGILYTRLSARHSPLTDFALQSFDFAHRLYAGLFASGALREGYDGALCGNFQRSTKFEEMERLAPALAAIPELAQVLNATEASSVTGMEQNQGGYWFPGSGWLHPGALCHHWLDQPGITTLSATGPVTLHCEDGRWRAAGDGKTLAEADCAVIASGHANSAYPLDWLPLQAIRGQTTHLPSEGPLRSLRAGLCHSGYLAPARNGVHCIGATFDPHDSDPALRPDDHRRNLDALAAALPQCEHLVAQQDSSQLEGRVAFRCASPDYLPMVGPVPDAPAFLERYGRLRRNARQVIPQESPCLAGLYLNTAHGSRGLTSAPLCAELLAGAVFGEPAPLPRELCRALAPARFLVRQLKRGQ